MSPTSPAHWLRDLRRRSLQGEGRDERGFRMIEELASMRDKRCACSCNQGFTTRRRADLALGSAYDRHLASFYGVRFSAALRRPDRLAVVWERNPNHVPTERRIFPTRGWRERNRSFTGLAALVPSPTTLGGVDPERVMGAEVSPEYFRLLGVRPAIGREFTAAEGGEGGPGAVILGDGLWRRRFGADSSIVGRAIRLDEDLHIVA